MTTFVDERCQLLGKIFKAQLKEFNLIMRVLVIRLKNVTERQISQLLERISDNLLGGLDEIKMTVRESIGICLTCSLFLTYLSVDATSRELVYEKYSNISMLNSICGNGQPFQFKLLKSKKNQDYKQTWSSKAYSATVFGIKTYTRLISKIHADSS
jgi:hypothetical protein